MGLMFCSPPDDYNPDEETDEMTTDPTKPSSNDNGYRTGDAHPSASHAFDAAVRAVQREMLSTFYKKFASYGPRNIAEIGLRGVVSRLRDKLARLEAMADAFAEHDEGKRNAGDVLAQFPDGESAVDAAIDTMGYGTILALLFRRQWPHDMPRADARALALMYASDDARNLAGHAAAPALVLGEAYAPGGSPIGRYVAPPPPTVVVNNVAVVPHPADVTAQAMAVLRAEMSGGPAWLGPVDPRDGTTPLSPAQDAAVTEAMQEAEAAGRAATDAELKEALGPARLDALARALPEARRALAEQGQALDMFLAAFNGDQPRDDDDWLRVKFTPRTNSSADITLFAPQKAGDVGFDLAISEDFTVPPTSRPVYIKTGAHVKCPRGMWARLVGRSSTARKLGLTVVEGTLDNGFTGELLIGVINHTNGAVRLDVGTRLAQLIFAPALVPQIKLVRELPATERGATGFGSTGER